MARKYVTDLIGDDYKKWQPGDWVLLSYPTGLGKTHFILHTLLRDAAERGEHLVYYCNRKFLSLQLDAIVKKQFLEELGSEGEWLNHYLHVRTYQNAERTGCYPHIYRPRELREYRGEMEVAQHHIRYYIFDEAQYPVADSPINPRTDFWMQQRNALTNSKGIHVFLTATPEPFLLFRSCLNGRPNIDGMQAFYGRYMVQKSGGSIEEHWLRFCSHRYINLKEQYKKVRKDNRYYWDQYASTWNPYYYNLHQQTQVWLNQLDNEIQAERERIYSVSREPFKVLYDCVERAYQDFPKWHYHLDVPPEEVYDYVDERYFDKLIGMLPQIVESSKRGERWLIFVRKKTDGETLQIALETHGCRSMMIDRQTAKNYDGRRVPRRSLRNQVLHELVWNQGLGCNVLISTSVLDNGISLRSDAVDHLVLCQPSKTSFLQMLGRVRVREGQKLRVYIQRQKPREIKGYIDQCRKDILFLISWELNGHLVPDMRFTNTKALTMSPLIEKTEELTQQLQEYPQRTKYLIKAKYENERDRINTLVLCQLMGSFYDMNIRAKQHGDSSSDPNYYLRYQLSWIGKTYDPTRWVDYQQTQHEIMAYLGQLESTGQRIDKAGQTEFRRECLRLLLELRQEKCRFSKIKARFSLEREKYPGLKVLNEVFADLQLPYTIRSKQPGKTKQGTSRETYWYIEKSSSTKEAEHPLQDAPELTDSQDTSGGSCSPSSGIPAG